MGCSSCCCCCGGGGGGWGGSGGGSCVCDGDCGVVMVTMVVTAYVKRAVVKV